MVRKSPEAFRTISEVADVLDVPPHVLRFWETRFTQVKPVKRGGGRRYYRPEDVSLLRGIRGLLYDDGMTIKGVQKILREKGVRHVAGLGSRVQDAEEIAETQTEDVSVPQGVVYATGAVERPQMVAGFAEETTATLEAPAGASQSARGEMRMEESDGTEDAPRPDEMPQASARADRKAALKALVAELQALRTRMAEGLPQ
ncbi:MAG: MerR family transcriptional regulator [Rhodobacteraceae bacterium]|nr:MerR family transcriptional regulator [Paracoccaceae bacterium]